MPAFLTGSPIRSLSRDGKLLFITRVVRLFAYGALSVVLVLYLVAVGLSETQVGLLLTLTLLGDTLVSLWLTLVADRAGRRRVLLLGAVLMALAGLLFAATSSFFLLLLAATLGIISPSGYEVGPFLSIEQSSLSHIVPGERRTSVFAWYNLVGSFATAAGALSGGLLVQSMKGAGFGELAGYRSVLALYALFGLLLFLLFALLSQKIEIRGEAGEASTPSGDLPVRTRFGLHRSRGVVLRLSALFSLDAFAGGFVLQSLVAYWFHLKFGVEPATLGGIFFGANLLAGVSSLLAARVAARIGLVRTMVFTHLPSNVLLMLVPLMPNLTLAISVLLFRFAISQMDVPARQSYTMAVVAPDERSAASGITGIARTLGASMAPVFTGPLLAGPALAGLIFFIGGGLKIVYDLLLYRAFSSVRPPEEGGGEGDGSQPPQLTR